MKKIFLVIILIGVGFYILNSYVSWLKTNYFKVIFFDVGQGDSALIVTPGGKTILIDGGPDNKVLRGIGSVLPFWHRQIDLLVITHAHDDHIIGLIEVSRRYKIKQVLYNNLNFETPVLKTLINVFKNKKILLTEAKTGQSYKFASNCLFNILSASKEADLDENDYSIVANWSCLDKNILLTGDAGIKVEQELLLKNIDLYSDILKISHHGSNTANSEDFLKRVNPVATVISVGINNKFKHPNSLILERLQKMAVDIYRTDRQGMRYFLANNKAIKLIK